MQTRRLFLESVIAAGALGTIARAAQAQETIKIGFSAPMTGPFAPNGKQMVAAAKFFVEQAGTSLAGKKIELIIRDDRGAPDQAKRIAQLDFGQFWPGSSAARDSEHRIVFDDLMSAVEHEFHAAEISEGRPPALDV